MKAAVLYGPKDIRVEDVPKPELDADGFLVKVRAVGICGTDVHTFNTGIFKEMGTPMGGGVVAGHEFAGDVVEVGKNIEGLKIGDRVTAVDIGGYAEYVRVIPKNYGLTPIILPDNVSYEEAATNEPLSVAVNAVWRGDPHLSDTVLIIGAGVIGLSCLQVIRALYPVARVFVADVSEMRLRVAAQLGADEVINAASEDLVERMLELTGAKRRDWVTRPTAQVDLVLECAGAAATPQQALEVVKPDTGRVVMVAVFERPSQIDFNLVSLKAVNILGIFGYSNEQLAQGLALIASGKVDRKPLITQRFPLAQAQTAFEVQGRAAESIKVVIIP